MHITETPSDRHVLTVTVDNEAGISGAHCGHVYRARL